MQMNIPASDKGVLSHGEELEAMNNAVHDYLVKKPKDSCPWKSYESCRDCGLYGECFPQEAQHGAA